MTEKTKRDVLVDKFNAEMDEYKKELCQKGAKYVYDKAYEIAIKNEIIYTLYDMSETEIDFIMAKDYTVHDFYEEWLDADGFNICDDIRECLDNYLYDEMEMEEIGDDLAEDDEGDDD